MNILAKKALSLLCVFAMLFTMVIPAHAADVTTIAAETVTIDAGEGTATVEVPIKVSDNTGILGMTLQVKYGEGLTLTGVVKGDALTSLAFTKPGNLSANPVNIVWDGEADADTSNGSVAVLTFTVPVDEAKDYAIEITTKGVFDDMLDPVAVETVNGKISVVAQEPEIPDEPVVTGTTISVADKTVDAGEGTETVEVPITVTGNTGILGMTLEVKYGDGLTLTGVVKGDALSSLAFTKPGNMAANPVNMVWDGEADADTSNGVIATLTFTVPKDTAKDYAIEIKTKGVFDDMLDPVEVTTVNGKITVVGEGPAPHEHVWGEGVITTPATHTAEGVMTYTCTCGETKTEAIAKTPDHEWDEGVITTPATHTTEGVMTYTCTCGETKTEAIAKTPDHEWDEGVITTPATHIAEGVMTYTCACGETKTEAIAKTPDHEWDEGVITTPATETTEGVKTYTCTCG
ncbi:MAG: hypothetical protein IKV86_02125, partial [Clostridia bacterium]|nr:hypothetical protein [Clostridia bacterium]